MLLDFLFRILGEADDIGEMGTDALPATESHDVMIGLRAILAFMCG